MQKRSRQRTQFSLRHTLGVERKLATALFVDLVGSTALVTSTDPEVARRRVTEFFELVSKIIEGHGGTVEKFAGDAVMAVFGVPLAHEDDAERALRAAFDIRSAVGELAVQCRIGVEAGEVVYEDTDSTLATGKAVNLAARLEQLAEPGEILVGEGVHRLVASVVELEHAGTRSLRGFAEPLPVWRAVCASERSGRGLQPPTVPLIGRDVELALLRNTFERTVRDRRAHLVTIYGEPGVGKSRLARDFIAGLDGVTVLVGRSLPYGEGITYWPLAEMVKAWAGIADDDSAEQAREKLLASCSDEAIVDLLALAAGVVEAVGADRSRQEIAWATREWAERLAATQPLVLGFEDVHWSEEPLRDLIEHLASTVRDAPLLILCLARPELLETDPGWGGGPNTRGDDRARRAHPRGRRGARRRAARRRSAVLRDSRRRARQDGGQPALRRGNRPHARGGDRRESSDSRHRPGVDRGPHRRASARLEDRASTRCGDRPRVLAGRARACVRRDRACRGRVRGTDRP
jgi:class 3 adenylate cyclase